MKCWRQMALCLFALTLAQTAAATVQAWLEHDQIAAGDTVQLVLQKDSQGGGQPDLTPLQKDFDVLGSSRSSNIQFINGKSSSQEQVQLTLAPKHNGKLVVPEITWGKEHSSALTLSVANGAAPGNGTNAPARGSSAADGGQGVFLESEVDPLKPYVQAAVHLKVRIYAAVSLRQASLDLDPSGDVLIQQLGKDRQSETTRNGRRYQLIERDYLLFPQRSGNLELPGPVLNAQVVRRTANSGDPFDDLFAQMPGGFGGTLQPLRLHGDPIKLAVQPRPAEVKTPYWLPSRALTLQGDWQPATLKVRVGDPLTLHLRLQAEGLTAAQLPDLAGLLAVPDGLKAYPDQAKLNDSLQGDGVIGERTQDVALIAEHEGRFTLPALTVRWWDVNRNVLRSVSLPEQTIVIAPGAASSSAPLTSVPKQTLSPSVSTVGARNVAASMPLTAPGRVTGGDISPWWRISTIVLAVLWLGTLALWLWSLWVSRTLPRSSPFKNTGKSSAAGLSGASLRKAFHAACRANDAAAAGRHLLAWGHTHWVTSPPTSLGGLAKRLPEPQAGLVRALERACYGREVWQGAALSAALNELPMTAKLESAGKFGIAALYD
jgi:hypothetical protein